MRIDHLARFGALWSTPVRRCRNAAIMNEARAVPGLRIRHCQMEGKGWFFLVTHFRVRDGMAVRSFGREGDLVAEKPDGFPVGLKTLQPR
ncbi:hypothetical protein B1F73_15735 [Pseudomonas syringae]|nr:hypothetical protein B1F77_00205 [Pseudomonas syringae]RXT86475.1 hypothetical protein B1F72_07180 [Pseudomonas syringae]RXT98704.1 hypothetical protein B1F73_15735 [Pseudomonas syringae]RXU19353.1 hypothetical protein B0A92_27550 [Pseudomonas syringae]TRN84924.1 hypothetical protein DT385_06660 [Pseudomonas syringae]